MAARATPPFRAAPGRGPAGGGGPRGAAGGPPPGPARARRGGGGIREVVKLQEGIGLRSITDGEFRRRIWWSEFLLSLEGVEGSYRGEERFRDQHGHPG